MAPTSFPGAVALVLAHEGGFVDHPRDPGGATRFGITRNTLAAARGRPATRADVRALAREEAETIYRRHYWNPVRGDDLPAGIDLATFDLAVHSGPTRAALTLQGVLGVPADGAVGPRTLAAAAGAPPAAVIAALTRRRLAMLQALPAWPVFGRGWRRRVLATEREAQRRARLAADLIHP
jgi:lysozyme family protein